MVENGEPQGDRESFWENVWGLGFWAIVGVVVASWLGFFDEDDSKHKGERASSGAASSSKLDAAESAVVDYYEALDQWEYRSAWQHLGDEQRSENIDFATWQSSYDTSIETNLRSAEPTQIDDDTVEVEVSLRAIDLNLDDPACDAGISKNFTGVWTVDLVGGEPRLSSADIEETASDEIARPQLCVYATYSSPTGEGGGDQYVPQYDDSGYDESESYGNGSGSSFCATHDCIANFDEGSGSVVQCEDGSYSHSGGIQGACSYHGGVSGYEP